MTNHDKLGVVVSVILLCLALSLIVELPTTLSFTVRDFPLTIRFNQNWLTAALLTSMACAGTASIIRLHPLAQGGELPRAFPFWILPGLAILLATILLPRTPDRIYALGGLAVTGILLLLTITAEYRAVDTSDPGYRTCPEQSRRAARLGLNFIAYLIALVLLALIHESEAHELLKAVAALAGSSLLALDLLRGVQQDFRRTSLYALIVGLVMGEIVWVLSYSKMTGLTAGILLLLIFYLVTGLARQGLLKLLDRRILIEFAVVALIGLALLLKRW